MHICTSCVRNAQAERTLHRDREVLSRHVACCGCTAMKHEDRVRGVRAVVVAALVVSLGTAGACKGDLGDGSGGAPETAGICNGEVIDRVGMQRLTRAEYNRTVRDLFGVTGDPANTFPPDSVTANFDNHAESLTTSPQLARLLLDAAEGVAAEALTGQSQTIIVCDPAVDGDDACARTTLQALALRVYRRPPSEVELDDLVSAAAFARGQGESFVGSIEHALTAMLMAPQFLYRNVPATGTGPRCRACGSARSLRAGDAALLLSLGQHAGRRAACASRRRCAVHP